MAAARRVTQLIGGVVLALTATFAAADTKGETVKIALIDPMGGAFANYGQNISRTFQYHAERANAGNPAGVKFEVVVFDNKASPQETLNALKAATDQGIRYVAQGGSSAAALALTDAVAKFNERNPGKEVIYLGYASNDPDLTGAKCNYWHFRFEADTSVKMETLTNYIKDQKSVKKIYLINQNYGHGQQFSRFAKENLARKRPDIQIVGDELHPMGQVKDFAPYIAKIKASGADTVLTGNWGPDLSLLIKAAKEAGLEVMFYAPLAMGAGSGSAIAGAGEGRMKSAFMGNPNLPGDIGFVYKDFEAKFKEDYSMPQVYQLFQMLPVAMAKAKSTDPVKVAAALEGLTVKSYNGDITMRPADHQLQQGMYISTWHKIDKTHSYNVENTGYTWIVDKFYDAAAVAPPNVCNMKRPN